MSEGLPHLALGTFGAGCAAGGLILWLAPGGRWSRLSAWIAGGAGLAGLLAATGLDSVEERVGHWGSDKLWELRDSPWELPIVLLLDLVGMAAFAVSLAVSFMWLCEAFSEKGKKEKTSLLCGSIGAFGWAMTVLHLAGVFEALWKTDLFASAPPRGLVEAVLTTLDMTGLVAALSLKPREKRP